VKHITSKRSVDLYRLAIGEAANCPEVGEAWYTHGPARTASFLTEILERHRNELPKTSIPLKRVAVILHDSLTGDVLYRLLAGITKQESDEEMRRIANNAVDVVLMTLFTDRARSR